MNMPARMADLGIFNLWKRYALFFIVVLIPLALISVYYVFIASDIYVSEAKITVKQSGQIQSALNISIPLLGNPLVREDALLLQEYILSYDMLNHLEKTLKISKFYQDENIDFIKRLPKKFTREEFFKYYKKNIVKVQYDDHNSVLIVNVYAFKPEIAYKINNEIILQCEKYINDISHRIAKEQMDFVEKELLYAYQKKQNAVSSLVRFQNTHRVVDPQQEIQANLAIISNLESQLAIQEAKLKEMLTYLNENSLQVQALKAQIDALKKQIEKEKSKLVGGQTLIALDYLNIKLTAEFFTDVYKATLSAFENARVEASRKIKNVVIVVSPNMPEEALYPKRAYNIALVSILLFLFYGIISIVVSVIKEHRV